ncbi:MAG: TRAP transporter small permease [Xanthobacteraceae bacterium]
MGAVGIVLMLLHICAYVIMRHVVASPIPGTIEIVSSYYMVLIAFLPLAWAEWRGEMVSVEVFAGLFSGVLKKPNQLFVALITAAAYATLTYTTWVVAMREYATKTFVVSLQMPLAVWPSYFILPAGFALATVVALLRIYLILSDDELREVPMATLGDSHE